MLKPQYRVSPLRLSRLALLLTALMPVTLLAPTVALAQQAELGRSQKPVRATAKALANVKAVSVVDRSVSFGWNCGPLYQDVIAALQFAPQRPPAMSFIGGLAGADLTTGHFGLVIERTAAMVKGVAPGATVWINEND